MRYRAPHYGIQHPPVATQTKTSGKYLIICAVISIVIGSLAIVLGIGLGVGLGLGLKRTDSTSTSSTSTCNANTATCGCPAIQPTISSRIVNADTAIPNSWPWMVAIYMTNGRLCGGTLVTYEHVLTAAHCVFDVTSDTITVYAGIEALSKKSSGQIRNVSTITIHSNYSNVTKVNDMAILKLSSPLTAGTKISLCCLSTTSSIPAISDSPVFIGWGRTTATSDFSDNLQQAVTRVVTPSLCNYTSVTDNQICTGNTTSVACYGDSGSPLMVKINNIWTCVGVVNMGLLTCDSYVVFTRVAPYISFITNATSS
uniref:Caldecrin isoform 1-like protein n=1 Tax=Adineta vaga TaxID=104782 RepID=B3G4M8_ADIVA|nr:caldecrin precursor isoform 1-like protein [Adineta vaga]